MTPQQQSGRDAASMQLLCEDGDLSTKCLNHIFSKYCTPAPPESGHALDSAFLTEEGLDRWAQDTNGAPFTQETKDELRQFMDVTEQGHLTFKGFLQIYALQTENDQEETWHDLAKHGFDRDLNMSRR